MKRMTGVQILALTSALLNPLVALASEPETTETTEIIVTALKRPSLERDVPISISTTGSAELERRGIATSTDLGQVVPGLVVAQNALFSQPTLRGIGTLSTAAGDEPNVTTYVDGVYQSQMFSNLYEFNSIERIEVLKGPQGTLFGRNATGGAINIVTRQPDPGRTTGRVTASYGDFNEVRGSGYIATGLGSNFAADIAVVGARDDGYVLDLVRGGRLANASMIGARSKLRFVSPGLEVTVSADYAAGEDRSGVSSQPLNRNTLARAVNPAVFIPTDPRTASLNVEPRNRVRQHGASLTVDAPFSGARFVSISSYRRSRLLGVIDTDATSVPVFSLVANQYSRTITQELRLQSDGGRIDWVVGGFAYDDRSGYDPLALSNGANIVAEVATRAYAGFGEATLPLGDAVKVTGGLRYSWERKRLAGAANGGATVAAQESWTDFSPRVSILWRASPQINFFATASRGFKSGVFNSSSLSRTPVRPERLDAVEIGVKSELDRLRFSVSAFRYWYRDLQVQVYDAATNVSSLQNAPSARIWGVDAEANVALSRLVDVRLAASYLDAKYRSFPNATVTQPLANGGNRQIAANVSGNDLIRSPGSTISIGTDAAQPLGSGEAFFSGSLYFNSGFFWDAGNRVRQPAYAVANAELGWRTDKAGRVKIALWARNLTNTLYAVTSQQSSLSDSINYARPRTFGIKAGFGF